MQQAQDTMIMTVKVALDVRRNLEGWAKDNLSSLTAELNRSVRERAEREQRKQREKSEAR